MGLEELEAAWNAKADRFNQWNELGLDEIVAFAQHQARVEAFLKIAADFRQVEEKRLSGADVAIWCECEANAL